MNEIRVRVADYAVAGGDGCIVTVGLGSCVAIVVHDEAAGKGALAHVLLPDPGMARERSNPARFPATVVPLLVQELRERGARGPYVAKLAGGASMFRSLITSTSANIGERNVVASREALALAGIPVVAEDVGGEQGRTVRYFVADGRVLVTTLRGNGCVL